MIPCTSSPSLEIKEISFVSCDLVGFCTWTGVEGVSVGCGKLSLVGLGLTRLGGAECEKYLFSLDSLAEFDVLAPLVDWGGP